MSKINSKEILMKIFKIILVIVCIIALCGNVCYAEESLNWYIKKRGNEAPIFPESACKVVEYGGIYIDENASKKCEKKLYLTFDAGYENGNIEKILDVMRDEEVTGAFFILSNLIVKNPQLVTRMTEEGHLVCNHTSNHKDITKLTDDEILANLGRLEAKYKEVTGCDMEKIFRFPEGRYNYRTLKLLHNNGYKTVFWSMAYDDWDNSRQMNSDLAKAKLLSTTHNGAIILLHPTSATNAAILKDLIREWKSLGYSFGSLKDI
jgi:peptidoglycan-N-acetylmuramic acid deacetylase